MSEFIVNTKACISSTDAVTQLKNELERYLNRLDSVESKLSASNYSYSSIARSLAVVIETIQSHKGAFSDLGEVIEQCMNCYDKTEKGLVGKKTESKKNLDVINKLAKFITDGNSKRNGFLESILLRGVLGNYVYADLLQILSGTYLVTKKIDGTIYMMLRQKGRTNSQIITWLENNIGGNWNDYTARNMKKWNFSVYDKEIKSLTRDFSRYFDNSIDLRVNKYFKNLNEVSASFFENLKKNFKVLEDFDYSDFSDMSKLGKTGKTLGSAATLLTIGNDVVDNFYDSENGNWGFSGKQVLDCMWDGMVDLGAAASSTAIGAAVGTLIVPPIGTVVGAGVGIVIDVVANNVNIFDFDGNGKKESFVNSAKDFGDNFIEDASSYLNTVFSF